MKTLRYKVISRSEYEPECSVSLMCTNRESSGYEIATSIDVRMSREEFSDFPIGAEFDLVPARTQT